MRKTLFAAFAGISLFVVSCNKNDNPVDTTPAPGTAKIDQTGGTLQSGDKNINVTIPAGALSTSVSFEVKELTNDAAKGVGKIYRFTDQQFLKPVTLVIKYDEAELTTKKTYPALLQLATRKSAAGNWEIVKDFTIDKTAKTITSTVDHFSDWTLVSTNGTLNFSVDGLSYNNLALSVYINGSRFEKPTTFQAAGSERYLSFTIDSTKDGGTGIISYAYHLLTIYQAKDLLTLSDSVALFREPRESACYTRGDGSNQFRFTDYTTTAGGLVTGNFTLASVAVTDNSPCQVKKSITGSLAYIVK